MPDDTNLNINPPEKRKLFEDAKTLTTQRKKRNPLKLGLIALACVAVLVGGGYLAATYLAPTEAEVEATAAPDYTTRLLEKSSTDVTQVTVNYDGDEYTILNTEDGYVLQGHEDFKLNTSTASSLISRGATLTSQSTVAENCDNLAEYGLEPPVATLTATYTDGTTATIELGNKSPLSYYYVKLAGDNTVYTAYSSVATTMMTHMNDLHTVEMPATLDDSAFNYVRIERPETTAVVSNETTATGGALLSGLLGTDDTFGTVDDLSALAANGAAATTEATADVETEATDEAETETTAETADNETADGTTDAADEAAEATDAEADTAETEPETAEPKVTIIEVTTRSSDENNIGIAAYKLTQPFEYDADSEGLQTLATNIASITINRYAGNVSEPDNPYGMENPLRISASDTTGASLNLLVGNKASDSETYICVDDTGDVYTTATSSIEFARTLTVAGIVDRFANIVNITKVDALDITTPDGSYELKIERIPELDEDGNVKQNDRGDIINEVYYYNGEETEEKAFKGLYQEVIGILVNGVTDDYDIDTDTVVSVTYHLNVEPYEFTVEYVEYDRDNYAVRRDGTTYFFVRKSKIDGMRQALADYGIITLPTE